MSIPVPNAAPKSQAEIIKHVDRLLLLNKEIQTASLPSHKERILSRIDYCEDRINALVYEFYGLTEPEIVIVENAK